VETRGAVYAALAAMLYGSAYVVTAIALRSYTAFAAAAWRGILGSALLAILLLIPALAAHRPRDLSRSALLRLTVLGILGGGVFILALNGAVATAGATVTAFVAGLYAVLAAVFAIPLLGERLDRRALVALLAALVGTVLLSDLRAERDTWIGIGIALVGAAAFALFLVLLRRWSAAHALSGPTIGIATMAIGAAVALVAIVLSGEPLVPNGLRADATFSLVWLAAGPGAAASVLVVAGMRRLPARRASVFLLLNPPTAAVLAFVLLGQRLSGIQVVGAISVLVAIGVASGAIAMRTGSRRSSRPGSEPPPRS
jgi:drug/metabolite transporter (DMT)-like permease